MVAIAHTQRAAARGEVTRRRVRIGGVVQGVGFRPFVYRLAQRHAIAGSVKNDAEGVCIEIEAPQSAIDAFLTALSAECPTGAQIQRVDIEQIPVVGDQDFALCASAAIGGQSATILPDLATCAACLQDIFDPANRRYRYPFTNCTQCGPRYSIVRGLPYDRINTSMHSFSMCRRCQAEYANPLDRRFHAQPNACPECGPQLALHDSQGQLHLKRHAALHAAAAHIRRGAIVALKGVGGFQLLVDAGNEQAVQRLRQRKQRAGKPLAVMVKNSWVAAELCVVTPLEKQLLGSQQAPIVLLQRNNDTLAPAVAPALQQLGVMLPYSPLHHLLLHEFDAPVVVTSGNLAGEPICISGREAMQRLANVADYFLLHDRGIVRPVDDSVLRVAAGRPLILRRSRGYAPLPIRIDTPQRAALAVGGELKNAVGLALRDQIVLSQHIGDLGSRQAQQRFAEEIDSLTNYYGVQPDTLVHDSHPDYAGTQWALKQPRRSVPVQHHVAHVFASMADNALHPPCLGVAWDGTGHGDDGTIWGGEFFSVTAPANARRSATFRSFPLPGASAAILEPRRAALGVLHAIHGADVWQAEQEFIAQTFSLEEIRVLKTMLARRLNCPRTSSVGRLFDAVAGLLGLRSRIAYEAEAAMQLESLAEQSTATDAYPFTLRPGTPLTVDWQTMLRGILADRRAGQPVALIAARFHNTLAQMLLAVARAGGHRRVVLGGGCFQNRVLLEKCVADLQADGFAVFWPKHLAPNDGGLAAGQLYWLALSGDKSCA